MRIELVSASFQFYKKMYMRINSLLFLLLIGFLFSCKKESTNSSQQNTDNSFELLTTEILPVNRNAFSILTGVTTKKIVQADGELFVHLGSADINQPASQFLRFSNNKWTLLETLSGVASQDMVSAYNNKLYVVDEKITMGMVNGVQTARYQYVVKKFINGVFEQVGIISATDANFQTQLYVANYALWFNGNSLFFIGKLSGSFYAWKINADNSIGSQTAFGQLGDIQFGYTNEGSQISFTTLRVVETISTITHYVRDYQFNGLDFSAGPEKVLLYDKAGKSGNTGFMYFSFKKQLLGIYSPREGVKYSLFNYTSNSAVASFDENPRINVPISVNEQVHFPLQNGQQQVTNVVSYDGNQLKTYPWKLPSQLSDAGILATTNYNNRYHALILKNNQYNVVRFKN